MEQTYAQSKAFGWDKATVDAKMEEGEKAVRAGFVTSTMQKNTLYMDHVIAVNNCAQGATSEAELGQSAGELVAVLELMVTTLQQSN